MQRGFSNDRTNQIITPVVESGLIGRSDKHRTQTTLKRAGCIDDKNICPVQLWSIKFIPG